MRVAYRRSGTMLGGLLLFATLFMASTIPGEGNAMAPPSPFVVTAVGDHGDNCQDCIDCSDGESHRDQMPAGGEEGEITGGTFVNLCRVAYSVCPGANHVPCDTPEQQQQEEEEDLLLSSEALDRLEAALGQGPAVWVAEVERLPWAERTSDGSAVMVRNCRGTLVARFPLSDWAN